MLSTGLHFASESTLSLLAIALILAAMAAYGG